MKIIKILRFFSLVFVSSLFFSCFLIEPIEPSPFSDTAWIDYLVVENNTAEDIAIVFGTGYKDIFFTFYLDSHEEFLTIPAAKKEAIALRRWQNGEYVLYIYSENKQGWITSELSGQSLVKEKVDIDSLHTPASLRSIPKYKKWNEFVDFSQTQEAKINNFGKPNQKDIYCFYAGCISPDSRTSYIEIIKEKYRLFRVLSVTEAKDKEQLYTFKESTASEWLAAFAKNKYTIEKTTLGDVVKDDIKELKEGR